MPFCTKCGNKIADDANFCTKCGNASNSSISSAEAEENATKNGNLGEKIQKTLDTANRISEAKTEIEEKEAEEEKKEGDGKDVEEAEGDKAEEDGEAEEEEEDDDDDDDDDKGLVMQIAQILLSACPSVLKWVKNLKIPNKKIFIIIAGISGLILALFFFANSNFAEAEEITVVKKGSMKSCPGYTVEQMVNSFMDNPEWEYIVYNNIDYINISGIISYENKPASALLQLWLKDKVFGFQAFEINDIPQVEFVAAILLELMCEAAKDVEKNNRKGLNKKRAVSNAPQSRDEQKALTPKQEKVKDSHVESSVVDMLNGLMGGSKNGTETRATNSIESSAVKELESEAEKWQKAFIEKNGGEVSNSYKTNEGTYFSFRAAKDEYGYYNWMATSKEKIGDCPAKSVWKMNYGCEGECMASNEIPPKCESVAPKVITDYKTEYDSCEYEEC